MIDHGSNGQTAIYGLTMIVRVGFLSNAPPHAAF
jgi:hypothetical protein